MKLNFFFTFLALTTIAFAQPPLKVNFVINNQCKKVINDLVFLLNKYKTELKVEVVPTRHADVIITNLAINNLPNKPIILIDLMDFATVREGKLKLLCDKRVKAIFCNYSLSPVTLNKELRVSDTYHGDILNSYIHLFPQKKVTISFPVLKKIKLVPWAFQLSPLKVKYGYYPGRVQAFDEIKSQNLNMWENINLEEERPIDVSFIGAIYNCGVQEPLKQLYIWHRTQMLNALLDMHDINKRIHIVNKLVEPDGRLEIIAYNEMLSILKKSKIIVSPWGYGEWCFRDFEAMLSGAVLIKPDSSFIQMKPNLYINNQTYVPCKADFSDLEEKIRTILGNFDSYRSMRELSQNLLLTYTEKNFVTNFVNGVKEVLT